MDWFFEHPLFIVFVGMVGACVGSYLNVVIYRVPRGMKTSDPKRSFCPTCRKDIPWYRNLPVITWVVQRGKCAECGCPIAFRYCFVEALTAALFVAAYLSFDTPAAVFVMFALIFILVSIGFIDAELMIIPVNFCWVGMGIGLVGGVVGSELVLLPDPAQAIPSWEGLLRSAIGLALGWGLLAAVVRLGKMLFGERKMQFEEARDWFLREPENDDEELAFVINVDKKGGGTEEEMIGWSDLFYRPTDRIEITGGDILVDGSAAEGSELVIRADRVEIHGETHLIEELVSLSGKAERVRIPREAMGGGDPPLMGMIGAFIGWQGVVFTLFASCVYAIVSALLGRIGFGRALPFGPFLALGCLTWAFGGWKLWEAYFAYVQAVGR